MRRQLMRLATSGLTAAAISFGVTTPAAAAGGAVCTGLSCSVQAESQPPAEPATKEAPSRSAVLSLNGRAPKSSASISRPTSSEAATALSKAQAEASFAVQQLQFQRCQSATQLGIGPTGGCTTPTMPTVPEQDPGQPAAPVVTITPEQAAATAVARLRLPSVAPGIGPSPNLNRWKMAAIGYPLWLWADGPTRRGPVADSAGGVNVSLDARVSSLAFEMGDGNRVSCPGHGTKWTPAVKPGTKSPTCGHTYTEPSLPAGSYQVTAVANWAVTWTAGGRTGVIDVPGITTRQLPVGELQSIITG